MDAYTQADLRAVLLIVATAGYQYSSTTPTGKSTIKSEKSQQQNGEKSGRQGKASGSSGVQVASTFGETLTEEDVVHDAPGSLIARLAPSTETMQKVMWTITTIEVITRLLIVVAPSSQLLPTFCPTLPSQPVQALPNPSPSTLLLLTLTILAGVSIRRACFRALGKNFTFAHVTRAKHSLVTWGPYAYARHASYTGLSMTHFGAAAAIWSKGGLMRECAGLGVSAVGGPMVNALLWGIRALGMVFTIWNVFAVVGLLARAPREDETLRAKFGKEWEAYRDRVPWRFVPYII